MRGLAIIMPIIMMIIVTGVGYADRLPWHGLDLHVEGPEERALEKDYQDKKDAEAWDRVQEYHKDPDHNEKPSEPEYDRAFNFLEKQVVMMLEMMRLELKGKANWPTG
jgi:hypothetical protein